MVLVTANWRRRGIATRLVDACLDAATQARPHHLAGRDAGGRRRLRPARLHADAAIAAAAAGEADGQPRRRGIVIGRRTSTRLIARDASAMGFDRSTLLSEFARASGSRIVSDRRRHGAGPRRPHRAAYRSAARRSRRSGAGAGRCHRALRERTLADRRRPLAGRVSATASSAPAGTSSGRFSACASAAPPSRPRNCRSPSPARNLDRNSVHAS